MSGRLKIQSVLTLRSDTGKKLSFVDFLYNISSATDNFDSILKIYKMKKTLLSVFSLLLGFSVMAQNSAVLKLNPEKNKVYRFKSVTEQTVSQTVNGIQQNILTNISYSVSLKMLDMTKDFLVTEVHFDTLITNTNSMGKTTSINSTLEGDMKSSEAGDIMSCVMNRLSKNPVFVKLDYSGKPLEVVNLKMLQDMILKDTSLITLTGPSGDAVKKQVAGSIDDNNLKRMIEMFTWSLPAKEVSKGDKWDINQQVSSGGMLLDIKTTCRLDEIKGSIANISVESKISAAVNAKPIESPGATVTYDNLQGMSKSVMVTDIITGLPVTNEAKTHIAGDLGVSGPGFSMQIPLDINGESKVFSVR